MVQYLEHPPETIKPPFDYVPLDVDSLTVACDAQRARALKEPEVRRQTLGALVRDTHMEPWWEGWVSSNLLPEDLYFTPAKIAIVYSCT